jgi:hypothetical protein
MTRREFIALLGGVAGMPAFLPAATHAQHQVKMPTIGFLGQSTPEAERHRLAAFLNKLRELGWIEGQTVAIEHAWGFGMSERFAAIAGHFVQLKVDVIVTSGTASVVAAKQATTVIPIVFAVAGDPIANNLVASLAITHGLPRSPPCQFQPRPTAAEQIPTSDSGGSQRGVLPFPFEWRDGAWYN